MTWKTRWAASWVQFLALVKFGWQSRRMHLLIVLFVAVVAATLALSYSDKSLSDPATKREAWWLFLDRVVTITTLVVAVAVWFGEIKEEWERRLPRRLFAYFVFDNRNDLQPVAICLDAKLAGEHDARNMGQQICVHMFDTKFLGIDIARFELSELSLAIDPTHGFKPIRVVFRMNDQVDLDRIGWKEESGKAMVWTPQTAANKKGEWLSQTDPLCDFRAERLNDAVIQKVLGAK